MHREKSFFFYMILQLSAVVCFSQVQIQNQTTEHLLNPIGLDSRLPRFSWQLISEKRNVLQSAYEIRVSNTMSGLNSAKDLTWNSGKVTSDSSVNVSYKGTALQSGKRYYWQVRVWDNSGKVSSWSVPSLFQMGMLDASDWKAKWIEPGYKEDSILRPSPMFRKQFSSKKKIQAATIYITAHGLYEAQINGSRIGDAYLTPGWTSYNKRLQYQVYDVTSLVKEGENAIGVTLGNGWYRGYLAWDGNKNSYGKALALLLQLDIHYTDGTKETIISDEGWKSSTGPIRSSEIYNGETIDNRAEKKGWTLPGYNYSEWSGVVIKDYPKNILIATYNEPVKKHETFRPVRVFVTPKGEHVIDFGQNLVGWVIVKASGKSGDTMKISHAEVLDKQGNFYTENLRAAKAEDHFIFKGEGEEIFEPHFTFHGFRYIKLAGFPGELKPENFTAVALYSDMKQTGGFTTSNELINQLQHNIEWGQKGNFLDVPTDCPQRDERLGWTGDAQVFSRTASFLRDVNNFFAKWLKDVAADQFQDGRVPHVIPNVLGQDGGSTGWSDVATIAPWNMYLAYGDRKILEDQYPSMKAWVNYMKNSSNNYLWNKGFHFGDWLSYMVDNDLGGRSAITDKYLIAQCFYAHSTQLLIKAAKILGKDEDVKLYTELLGSIKDAFVKEYVTGNGRLVSGTQTAYVLALQFDMLPDRLREQAVERLVENIRSYDNHLSTGFLGTPYICHVLSRFGKSDVAYQLLLQQTFPSWIYPVKMGATTIWERWNGIRPDGSFEPASMNSFNHYAYGAIGDWMYRQMIGLDTDEDGVGYKKIRIQPHIGGGFTNAAAFYQTHYGMIHSGWKIADDKLFMEEEIPANTTATIYIPVTDPDMILENGKKINSLKDIQVIGSENGYFILHVGSGKYNFSTEWNNKAQYKNENVNALK